MTDHQVGTRQEWLAARLELLDAEKALTRRSDELAQRRQELPWVRVNKDYRFDTEEGRASLADLFRGRSQLLVYHFMFVDRRRLQRRRRAPCQPRRDAVGGIERAASETAGIQTADGLDFSVGVFAGRRLQLRLQRLDHRRAAARGRQRIQLSSRRPRDDRDDAAVRRDRERDENRRRAARLRARAAGNERFRS